MLLSIIIPAYNAGQYLEQCLSKLICDTPYPYEVIVVNDGSQDNTAQIAMSYAERYPFIHYIAQPNGGVSAARNAGLAAAQGQYITFVDADDELLALSDILATLRGGESYDLLLGDYHEISADGSVTYSWQFSVSIADNRELLDQELLGSYLLSSCWAKFYRTDIIRQYGLLFQPGVQLGEDLIFLLEYISHIRSFHCLPFCLYNYRQLDSGAVRRLRSQINDATIRDKESLLLAKHRYMETIAASAQLVAAFYDYQLADMVATINLMIKDGGTYREQYAAMRAFTTAPQLHDILVHALSCQAISAKRRVIAFLYLHRPTSALYLAVKRLIGQ